jgi:hypothetical protein
MRSRDLMCVVGLAASAVLTGCATVVRPYPFCTYNGVPDAASFALHLKQVNDTLATLAADPLTTRLVEVDQRKWLIVKTRSRTQRYIAEAWAPLACVATRPYRQDLGARKYRVCLLTVQRNLASSNGLVAPKDTPEFNNPADPLDSDSQVPSRLLWCNGTEELSTPAGVPYAVE